MSTKRALMMVTTLALTAANTSFAAETGQMPMRGMMGGQGGGMMSCPMMSSGSGGMGGSMGGGMMGHRGMPALPPGNEKLQLQMHAEIMQKVGEIMTKYAAQIQPR